MLPPNLYNRENLERVRYAQLAATGIAVIVCGYLVVKTVLAMQDTWSADRMLRRAKTETATLSREVGRERAIEARLPLPSDGGVDSFAVRFAGWASDRRISVESFVPEGPPTATEITIEGSTLGVWNANKVRVKGQGAYADIMSILDQFRSPPAPVQLDSFALQSSSVKGKSLVKFDLVLTVYERKAGPG